AAWSEGDPKWRTLPRNHYRLVQSVAPVPTSSGLLNADCSVMAVHIYTTDHTADTIERIVEAVDQFDLENAVSPITFRLAAGNIGVMAATNEEVESSQFRLLGFVYMAVIVICLLTFRSLASTMCVVIPLAIASLLTYGLMAILEIGLKISTLPVIALGCGIGVDYGIYIFSRIRYYGAQGLDFTEAYLKTLATVGSGVMFTGLTLAVSVATWLFSSLQFQADMGVILMFMFVVNMIGAIVLLPALGACISRIKHRFTGALS
ncbi:MAG: MMPL family transporter, partial [Gammaproteobacteria bacterium]|nr:MMPL family transporter [Gammaproteobacteria bacterium]